MWLKDLRKQAGLTQTELAKLSGVSYATINSIENRYRKYTSLSTIEKLAKALKCAATDITDEIVPPSGVDLTGRKFTRLKVLGHNGKRGAGSAWICQCDCGKIVAVRYDALVGRTTCSCGCLNKEQAANLYLTAIVDGTMPSNLNGKAYSSNTSGRRGVTWVKKWKKYKVSLGFKGHMYYLGAYDKFEDAVKAREEAEEKYYKPFLESLKDGGEGTASQ